MHPFEVVVHIPLPRESLSMSFACWHRAGITMFMRGSPISIFAVDLEAVTKEVGLAAEGSGTTTRMGTGIVAA